MLKDSGTRREFTNGAVRDAQEGKGRFDLLPWDALWEVSKIFEKGANKYEARNWEKGINYSAFLDSAIRHLTKFQLGWTDEPHLAMAAWNVLCLLTTAIRVGDGILPKELADLPFAKFISVAELEDQNETARN